MIAMVNIWQKPAAVITRDANKARMQEIRESEEWREAKASWLIGKVCLICGKPAQIPHHPDLELYLEIDTYLDLNQCDPYCHHHHRKQHAGWTICPACRMDLMAPGAEECWRCHIEQEEKNTKNTDVMRVCLCPHCNKPESSSAKAKQKCQNCGVSYDHSRHEAVLR